MGGGNSWAQNLLTNSDFATVGALASGATDRYAVGEPWVSNVTFANMGIRVMASNVATEGGNVLVWRGSGNNNYISQPVEAEAGAAYEVTINQVAGSNAHADFYVGIGTEAGKYDVASTTVHLGNSNNGKKTVKFLMPEDATGNFYFTFANTPTNTADKSDPVSQIDYIKMQEINALDCAKELALNELPSAGTNGIFSIPQTELDEATQAINNATSRSEIDAIVRNHTIPALSGSWAILNATNGLYLGDAVLSAESVEATFEKASNGFYIKVGDNYINMKGGNTWSMSADATPKTAWTFTLADGKYTIQGPNGLIGTDATTAGSAVYGNKDTKANGYWTIVDLAAAALQSAKGALQELVNNTPVPTANIEGRTTSTVQWASSYVTALPSEISNANDLIANSNSVDEVNACINTLEALKSDVVITPSLNTPYNIIMAKEGLGWTGNAVTFTYSEGNQNNYAMAYSEVAGQSNFNQAIYFAKNANNEIYMYITDADGKNWYVTDGSHVGSSVAWAGSQVRMTDVEADAMPISFVPSLDKEGVSEIINEWTGEHVGSTNNNGFYCSNDNYELSIQPAANKQMTITLAANYGTVILPAACAVPDGINFYSVSELDGETLVLKSESEVNANTPYIMEGEAGASFGFNGLANAYNATYTAGLLTGVYTPTPAIVDTYVLQKNNDVVGFYLVDTEGITTVTANHAYLTAPASSANVRAFRLDNNANAIEAISAIANNAIEAIYNANGVKVNALQKGINVVKMQNGKTQKVLVK